MTRIPFSIGKRLALLAACSASVFSVTHAGVLVLDGDGDWVSFENAEGLIPVGDDSFTLEAWLNPTSPVDGQSGGQITFWGNQAGNQSNGFRMRGPAGVRHYFWGNDHDEDFEDGSIIGRNFEIRGAFMGRAEPGMEGV